MKWLQQAATELLARQEHGLRIEFVGAEKTAMQIDFESPDPYTAQARVSAVVHQLIDPNRASKSVEILDNANLPQSPNFPNRMVIAALGLAFGVGFGAIAVMVMRRRQMSALA